MSHIQLQKSYVQKLTIPEAQKCTISVDVLRLDVIHPIVSGNKWFKLQEYIKEAQEQEKKTVATFGGAYSNHIIATAAACAQFGLKSVGIIRGEEPKKLSPTLLQAMDYGMKLYFINRENYFNKELPEGLQQPNIYIINEGGYGKKGALGAEKILKECNAEKYTHLCAATGTGTMLAGLITGSQAFQKCIGITVLKNNFSIEDEVNALLPIQKPFTILYDYHFGGYAKSTAGLINFMNQWYEQHKIPSDFIYTGKLFFAITDLLAKEHFDRNSKLLIIHSGGLQGNRSLPNGTLIFPSI